MNNLKEALKMRSAGHADKHSDHAPPTPAMPGEAPKDNMAMDAMSPDAQGAHQDPMAKIMSAIQSDPVLLAKVDQLIAQHEASESPAMEASEHDDPMDDSTDEMDSAVVGKMSAHDKSDMSSGRKPKGLADRAQMEALKRVGSKSKGE